MLIYLHGFNSSPASHKAKLLREKMMSLKRADAFVCPKLSHRPIEAIAQIEMIMGSCDDITLVGSSLGGYYATYLAEKYGCKAALVNPAVNPALSLETLIGPQKNYYTGEEYVLTREHFAQLKTLAVAEITQPERYLLLTQTGDEVLDYRLAVAKFHDARQIVIEGGDHGFQNFDAYLDTIVSFADQ